MIDWIAGASVPAPTRSDSDGRPRRLTVTPPAIVGRPATVQDMPAVALNPEASDTEIVAVALPALVGVPVISPVVREMDRPGGRPAACQMRA